MSFLALFLKKNSFIPSEKAQEVEFGFKRCNSRFSDLAKNRIVKSWYWGSLGREFPSVKFSSQRLEAAAQVKGRITSGSALSWWHATPGIHTAQEQTFMRQWCRDTVH